MIQWLLKHFSGCPVGENVVVEAAKGGHLWVLEVLEADNSHGGIQWNDESLGEAAKQGHWELVEWLDQRTSTPDSRESIYGVMDGAIQANDLELVKWVIANGFGIVDFGETSQVSYETNWAARKDILWYLLDGGYGESARVVEGALLQAADVGDLVLLQTLLARNEALDDPEDIYMDIWSSACGKGHMEVIQWLLIHPAYIAEPEAPCLAMIWAASNGRLEMINWLLHQDFSDASLDLNLFEVPSECNSGHTSEAVLAAAKNGHLGVIQLFHSLTQSIQKKHRMSKRHCRRVMYLEWSSAVMDTAAANGHLEVVMWLHANRSEGCTTKAMDEATANGHLDVVRWLHSNRYEGCTTAAMDMTAAKRAKDAASVRPDKCGKSFKEMQIEILEWLRVNRSEGCTINAMTGAATAGNIEVLDWLYDKAIAVCTQETMDVAACQGHLNVLEWLRNRYTVRCTPDALNTAAINGHLKVVRWLLANRYEGCAARAIRLAASGRDLSVVQCLAPHCSQAELMRAMHNAIASGRFETMVYLHAQRNDEASDEEKRELRNDEEIQEIWRDADRFSYLGLSYPREIRAWLEANYQIAT